MKTLTDDEVKERAAKWARLHKNERMRSRMDECLAGISDDDVRRVYLCGQRIVGGLPMKVIPATTKGGPDGNNRKSSDTKRTRRQRDNAA